MVIPGTTDAGFDPADDAPPPEETPRIVVDLSGEIVDLNPAAREAFPELPDQGLDHPLLSKAPGWLRSLDDQGRSIAEVYAGGQAYLIHMAWDTEAGQVIFTVSRA